MGAGLAPTVTVPAGLWLGMLACGVLAAAALAAYTARMDWALAAAEVSLRPRPGDSAPGRPGGGCPPEAWGTCSGGLSGPACSARRRQARQSG